MSESIHPDTTIGSVSLTVSNLDRSLSFYQERLGFQLHRRKEDTAYLGAGRSDVLVLTENPGATQPGRTTGLYHFAVLVPSRFKLAQSLQRLIETRTPVQGFADHLVSEAIYMPDPDGNGIEIYRDRRREDWPIENGQLRMATDPLDIDGLLEELHGQDSEWEGLHPDTVLGHMHLHVADLGAAERFYRDVLGFDLIMRYGPSASFLSAGGYHHHIGINTWAGVGVPAPPDGAVGLRWFTIVLPNQEALESTSNRIQRAGNQVEERQNEIFLRDPSENSLVLTTRSKIS